MRFDSFVRKVKNSRDFYEFVIRDWVGLGMSHPVSEVLATMRFSQNLEPILLEGPRARRVMVISGRPGTELLGMGGTLIRLTDRGTNLIRISVNETEVASPEEAGKHRGGESDRQGSTIRKSEFPGEGTVGAGTVEVRRLIEGFRPGALFAPSLFDGERDHLKARTILVDALKGAGIKSGVEIWCYEILWPVLPNVMVDITEVVGRKREAGLMSDREEVRDGMHCILGLNATNSRFLQRKGTGRYVEKFLVLPVEEFLRLSDMMSMRF
jgi:hypothetical protein